jgi:Xaa-Pro aminopeptidase
MEHRGLDGLLLLKHDAARYVTEFYTKGYRPFLDFEYAAVVPRTADPILGFTNGGEDRRVAIRSRITDARRLPGLKGWPEALAAILADYGLTQGRLGFDLLPHFIYQGLGERFPALELVDASDIWADLTAIKHPLEVELIEQALRISQAGVSAAARALRPGATEIEVSAAGEYAMRRMGSEMNPFIPVVSSGPNSAIWERVATPRQIQDGDLVILDFGCVYRGYTGDFARTTIVGEPRPKQRDIYRVAHAALQAGLEAVRPGVLCSEVDRVVRQVIAEAGYAKYQHPWSSGHQLGFGLHGEPLIGPGVDVPLQAGMVINIEPSVYTFDDPSVGGVEIEDTLLVTETGHRRLTDLPYEAKLLA